MTICMTAALDLHDVGRPVHLSRGVGPATGNGACSTGASCRGDRHQGVLRRGVQQEVGVQINVVVAVGEIKNGIPSSMPCPSNLPAITPSGRPFSVSLGVPGVGNCRRVKCTRQPKIGIVSKRTAAPVLISPTDTR